MFIAFVLSFAKNKHLYFQEGGHIAPPRIYSNPERGFAEDFDITAAIRKIWD